MNERQPEADSDWREAFRGSCVGGSQNDYQEHEGQHHFGGQTWSQREPCAISDNGLFGCSVVEFRRPVHIHFCQLRSPLFELGD